MAGNSPPVGELAKRFGSIAGVVAGRVDPAAVVVNIASKRDPEESYSHGVHCDAGGRFEFTGLPAGEYIVVARCGEAPGAESKARVEVELKERERRTVEIAFE